MKNNIANAYLGQKAAQKMSNEIAQKNTTKQSEKPVSLISTMMLRNGIGGTLNQDTAPKASIISQFVKSLSQKLFLPKTA